MPERKNDKKSAFSCHGCRTRKVKCGAEQPACRRCVKRGEECVYKLAPTLSYTERLERRVQQLEAQLASQQGPSTSGGHEQPAASPSASSSGLSPGTAASGGHAVRIEGLKVDDKGMITYHGSTSFFQAVSSHAKAETRQQEQDAAGDETQASRDIERRERLVNNAWQQRVMESYSGIPEPFQYLLDLHWCWIQPLFNFIYRPAFTRDMQTMGPYYSHSLMSAVMAHSARWGRRDPAIRVKLDEFDGGRLFSRQVRSLIFEDLENGVGTVPTVQTLLLLSAQECGAGNTVQAWVYSGIAFRLVDHLGICIDGQRFTSDVQLSDEDMEIRHRLFWSCYFWDKIISLYLGRRPTFKYSDVSPPPSMFDDSTETELWVPHGVTFPSGFEYPPTPAHSTSCFIRMCELSVIFNEILSHIYDPLGQNTQSEIEACVTSQSVALDIWWRDLPPFLKLEPTNLPPVAPPSHIVVMNCLYHTFRILLYRPMLTRRSSDATRTEPNRFQGYLEQCVTSAVAISAVFDLFVRSFGYGHCILSLSYSVYIAVSIFLLQVQAHEGGNEALHRLLFCVDCLEQVKDVNPVIVSALKPIHEILEKAGISTAQAALGLASIGLNDKIPAHITHTADPGGSSASAAFIHNAASQIQQAPPTGGPPLLSAEQLPLPPMNTTGQLANRLQPQGQQRYASVLPDHQLKDGVVDQFPDKIFDAASTLDVLKVNIQSLDIPHDPVPG
ncbi:fungal-specific transcription factor domain-containing protein [Microdochium trichocladiopsis]|uniref:Fungal-specific transcription factor domain-containing protein n=1 Tax=Microdochium trichocladiopsis TaxID=1682393 RepID=A0A9P9BR21_9PEZI|nr:fungal-specific transcription factor domain-containing protein [Microdochium trichocladiopsis]KAH7031533.1 fungal-specific transcription factor domain-containing protein [Microdochium trichocladiopsis]